MASTESETLKFIWGNKGKTSWFRIVKELRFFSPDYCRLICKSLIKKKFVEFSDGQYKITNLGKKELEGLGVIEKAPKESKLPTGQVERVVKPKRKAKKEKKEVGKTTITKLPGFSPKLIEALKKKGFKTLEDIATTSVSRFVEIIEGLKLQKAAEMINEARAKLRKEGKEYLWEE